MVVSPGYGRNIENFCEASQSELVDQRWEVLIVSDATFLET
jgi:hypothetical protein